MRRTLIVAAGLAVFAIVIFEMGRPIPRSTTSAGRGDVALYRALVNDMRAGHAYYDAFGSELRLRGYPTRSVFNWREPLLYRTLAWLSVDVGRWLLFGLSLLLLVATVVPPHPTLTPLFMAHALSVVLVIEPVYFTELWAGICLGLSATAYARSRRVAGVAWAILALAVRELAAPYCVAATLLAVWRRQWREVRVWALGGTLYAGYYGWHAWQVWHHLLPGDLAHSDSWVYGGGVQFLLHAIQATGVLFLAPPPVFAAFVIVAIAAGWAPEMPTHVRLGVIVYAAFFVVVGQPFNAYWGLMLAPLLALWVAHAPSGIRTLFREQTSQPLSPVRRPPPGRAQTGDRRVVPRFFFAALLKAPDAAWELRNARNGRVLAGRVVAAVDSDSRRAGLLKHATFDEGQALIIAPSNAIHTFFMRFPIDVAFVRRDGRIVKARSALKPWRMSAALRAFAVIELPSGTLSRCDTAAQDILELALGAAAGEEAS